MKTWIFAFLLLMAGTSFAEQFDWTSVNNQPYTKHKIVIDNNKISEYTAIAKSIGLEYGKLYGYAEYADVKRINKIGIAGHYDYLLLSTGGNGWDNEDDIRAQKVPLHWETMYFDNIDVTIIRAVISNNNRSHVKLLKLAKGRVPDLHLH